MPTSVVTDGAGNVYVCDYQLNGVYKITPAGVQTKLPLSLFTNPAQLGIDAMGNLYINAGGTTVLEYTPGGIQTTFYQGSATDTFLR